MDSYPTTSTETSHKRPRSPQSPSNDLPPPSKSAKTHHSTHLQINYLARQYAENIPLVSTEDSLPQILRLVGEYDGVLHRHESIAGNLGACPIGPLLLKRFERLFDGPPRILKTHGKEANITWLDVVEFARNKPEQFNLEKMRNGIRVCQFYTKQSRVEISEEDYVLIASGMPQKLIPPQPIMEDEEKELAALEILDKNLSQIIQLADQISARARQLNHRLKGRKGAILSRREAENESKRPILRSQSSPPPLPDDANGLGPPVNGNGNGNDTSAMSVSPPIGFTAVNARQSAPVESTIDLTRDPAATAAEVLFQSANTDNIAYINGTSIKGASPTLRAELMKKFFSSADREARSEEEHRRASAGMTRSSPQQMSSTRTKPRSESMDKGGPPNMNSPAVAIPNTPASLMPYSKPSQAERDDGGPYKAEMVNRMESLHRGERILPPCDRCRRLHMDCLKNLTACMGCTKKHAKCSWKDVREEELSKGTDADARPSSDDSHRMEIDHEHRAVEVVRSPYTSPVTQATHQDTPQQHVASVASLQKVETITPPGEMRSTPIHQHLHEAANGRPPSSYSKYTLVPPLRQSVEQDEDEGDRLQALAAQVYRTASQNDAR